MNQFCNEREDSANELVGMLQGLNASLQMGMSIQVKHQPLSTDLTCKATSAFTIILRCVDALMISLPGHDEQQDNQLSSGGSCCYF